jgi:hypothetical protein
MIGFTGFFRTPVLLDEGLDHSLYFSAHQKPQLMAEAQTQEILGMFVVTKGVDQATHKLNPSLAQWARVRMK